jgi:hypothetical protein
MRKSAINEEMNGGKKIHTTCDRRQAHRNRKRQFSGMEKSVPEQSTKKKEPQTVQKRAPKPKEEKFVSLIYCPITV